ncbi:PREDICTED: uncharacterized protein LOC109243301 [Nicotiana attenuata]|uniref:uncharacterized protein LOC109243301 n=1 Tax=Nicotiana attenuata TaxID=49451 RepID=UPI00090501C3|nr:PREDICTED: uncharacterized protein LOC109243301 [Nicotiana attenuata]
MRKSKDHIASIYIECGIKLTDPVQIENEFISFFAKLMGESGEVHRCPDAEVAKQGRCLDQQQKVTLVKNVTNEEILAAIKDMPHDKAPGIDGFPIEFFTTQWTVVGSEVCAAVKEFFEIGTIHKGMNCTAVTVIPKVPNPSQVKEFRPIACCTTLYEIITKVITNRIKSVMGDLIGESQSAFIDGRSNTDNILFIHELFKGYNRKGISPSWIMEFITTGELAQLENHRHFKFRPRCKKLEVIHIYFEDDLLMFCKADITSIRLLQQTFLKFYNSSSLQANTEKSSINLAGISDSTKQDIMQELGYTEGTLPFRYLGVPLASKKLSIIQCWPLVEKITQKINCWTSKLLSYTGRLQLIKSVLFGYGTSNITKKALVAWNRVCWPQVAGGLNVMNLYYWNKAAVAKHPWAVTMKKDSLWIRWVHTFYIRNRIVESSPIPKNVAWVVRKIIETRNFVLELQGIQGDMGHSKPIQNWQGEAQWINKGAKKKSGRWAIGRLHPNAIILALTVYVSLQLVYVAIATGVAAFLRKSN